MICILGVVYIAWFALLVTVQRTAGQKGICNPRPHQHRGVGGVDMVCDTVTGKWTAWKTASVSLRKGARPRPCASPVSSQEKREKESIPGCWSR